MQKIIKKTHYEQIQPYLTKHGFNVDELTKKIRSVYGDNCSFKDFQKAIQINYPQLCNATQGQLAYYSNIFFHFYMMKVNHEKIYTIMPQLAAKLADTNLNIDSIFLKSPYREIYIQIDNNLYQIIDTNSGKHIFVEGFYVYLFDRPDGIKEIRVMAASIMEPTPELEFNDHVYFFRFELGKGKVIDLVKEYINYQITYNKEELEKSKGNVSIQYMEELTKFIFNTLLYITSKDPDIVSQLPVDFDIKIENKKSNKKIKKLLKRQEKVAGLSYILVGSKMFDNSNNVEDIHKHGDVAKWKLEKRIFVEGYWKLQWYGSEKDNSKIAKHIFIQPYYKGPELAEMLHKQFKVGKS